MSTSREPTREIRRARLTRRDLLKIAQVGGAAGLVGAGVLAGRRVSAETVVKGNCRLCTMHCGVIARTRGTELVRIEGDPDARTRGFICVNGASLREIVHSEARVRTPLRRNGNHFEEISWETALREIAQRMNAIKEKHGARAVAVQTGWPFVRHPLVPLLHRFMRAFGSPNVATVASLCEATGRMGRAITFGSNAWPDVTNAKTLFAWGANPAHSAPPFTHMFAQAARRGRNLVVVDPYRTELAQLATLHLQVRPGTDGALALGMIKVVLDRGWLDEAWVRANTVGLDELRTLVEAWPLARVEEVTGVPGDVVEKATTLFAREGPTATWEGLGIEHHVNGFQSVRAVSCLQAVCGYVDIKGGVTLHEHADAAWTEVPLPAQFHMKTQEPVPPAIADKPIGYDEYPLFEACNRQAQANLFPRAILEDRPYALRGLILVGSNTFLTGPGSARSREAAGKLELLVSVDPFLSRSGELADYVLPATTFAESPTVQDGDQQVERSGLVREQHQARADWRIVFDLAHALGLGRYFPWKSLQEALAVPRVPWMEDPAHALVAAPLPGTPSPPRWPTVSGRMELRSSVLERFGHDPLPTFQPPAPTSTDYPLVLVSGPRTRPYINSQFRGVPTLVRKMDRASARLHPDTLRRLSITDGARVVLTTRHGTLQLSAAADDAVHRDCVVIPHGWADADANALTAAEGLDPVTGFPVFRSLPCRVEPARTT